MGSGVGVCYLAAVIESTPRYTIARAVDLRGTRPLSIIDR